MAAGKIRLQAADTRIYELAAEEGAGGNVTVTLPKEGGTLTVDTEVVHKTGDETIDGIKTFGSFSITPSSAPTTNYQVANKKYVDDNKGISLGTANTYDIGVGQTWQDVTGSRVSGTTYTNSTGKPIFLAVFCINANFTGVVNINGISITYTTSTNTAYAMQSVQIIVPHGNTYSVTFTDVGVAHKWLELR